MKNGTRRVFNPRHEQPHSGFGAGDFWPGPTRFGAAKAPRTGLCKDFFKDGAYGAVDLPLAQGLPITTLAAKKVDTHDRVEVAYTLENGTAGSVRLNF